MSSVLTRESSPICSIPADAECFDASGVTTDIPLRGEQKVLASFQLHPQYCGVLTYFAQFTDLYATSAVNIETPGLEWIIQQNGKPVFPYIRLEMIINPWGCNCLPVMIRLDESAKIEFIIRNTGPTTITKVAGRIMGRYWYNSSFGGR